MNLFGKKKQQVVHPTQAISKLQETQTMLEKKECHLDKQITDFKHQATTFIKAGNKIRALYFMKKAKILEKQLQSTFNMKLNLETQIASLMQSITNIETISAIQIGKDAFNSLDKKMDPEKVADVMDDLAENMNKVEEVADVLGQPISSVVLDEDELLEELAEISIQDSFEIPKIPKIIKKKEDDEKELRELELLMN